MKNVQVAMICMVLCGLLFLYLGYLIWKKEMIGLIHDYHYTKVKESDKKAYTGMMGKALTVIGAGTILSGMMLLLSEKYSIVCVISFMIGLIMMIYAQIKYNHGIF